MQVFRNIIARIKYYLRWARKSRPEDIPRKLDPQTLEMAMKEARFLFSQHVDVRSLEPGEVPETPKAAGPAFTSE